MRQLEERLDRDSAVQVAMASLGGDDLFAGLESDVFLRLDDATIAQFVLALRGTVDQLPAERCASAFGLGAELSDDDFTAMLEGLDTATVDRWLAVVEQAVYAQTFGWPRQALADEATLTGVMLQVMGGLTPAEQQRFAAAADSDQPAEQCWFARTLMGGLASRPASELGPLFRALIAVGTAGP
jgi:hypothetical protein